MGLVDDVRCMCVCVFVCVYVPCEGKWDALMDTEALVLPGEPVLIYDLCGTVAW